MIVGELVVVTHSFLGSKIDSLALVYDNYGSGVCIIIIEDGNDLGGFSLDEIDQYLISTGVILQPYIDYEFKSVNKLSTDYEEGRFDLAKGVVDNFGKMLIRDAKLRKIGINN